MRSLSVRVTPRRAGMPVTSDAVCSPCVPIQISHPKVSEIHSASDSSAKASLIWLGSRSSKMPASTTMANTTAPSEKTMRSPILKTVLGRKRVCSTTSCSSTSSSAASRSTALLAPVSVGDDGSDAVPSPEPSLIGAKLANEPRRPAILSP